MMVGGNGFEPMTSAMSTRTASNSLNSYLKSLRLQGLSVNYVNKVTEFLTGYVRWANVLSPDSALAYFGRYTERKPNTRARYATYLKGFLGFLGMPWEVRVKVPRQLPAFVQDQDIERLRACIEDKHTHKSTRFRDLVLLETAAKTGLRRAELANLRVRDIDFEAARLMVVGGKGGKDRVIPLVSSLKPQLQQLCQGKDRGDRVFGLNYRSLGMKFYIWAKKAGVPLHAHSFRHHFATTLVAKGANIRAVQELLGHTNLNTTQVYLAVTGQHLEEAIGLLD